MRSHFQRLLAALFFAVFLSACASSQFNTARANANQVTNGMTVAQAIDILGTEPSHRGPDFVEWRRGNAQQYDATPRGSVRFSLRDGVIVDVPPGGIFGEQAVQQYNKAWMEAFHKERADEEAKRIADEEDRAKRLAKERANAAQEIAEEMAAARTASVRCANKASCTKVFALAQIYIAQNADQKIQVATDTIIQTYNPTDNGKIGMSVVKAPRQGTTEEISITPSCKESEQGYFDSICRKKRTSIYAGFRPFVEAELAK